VEREQRIAEKGEGRKIEERKMRYWNDTGERGTLHAFGEDDSRKRTGAPGS
jgi:hypothetical protein